AATIPDLVATSIFALVRNELFFARRKIESNALAELVDSVYLPAIDAASRRSDNVIPTGPFAPVTRLVNDAVAAPRLPGAVVHIGHAGNIVFRQAFGVAFLQLYERDLVHLDEPVQTYLPEFNAANDPRRARVTLRMLLTHTSGIGGDLSHQGPWGLTQADKADGIHRALTAPLAFDPGQTFHYSDINFIILGALIEKLTDVPLDIYVQDNVFAPLGMANTRYLPATKACGEYQIVGTAIAFDKNAHAATPCPSDTWNTALLTRIAPTAHD
ncbi:serine hydrolase, partial [Aduncisulcus paluster]